MRLTIRTLLTTGALSALAALSTVALPGRAAWLDDRTAAVTAIPAAAWPQTLASLGPWLVTVEELLDEQHSGVASWTQYLDVPRLDQASQKPWWKFW